MHSETGRSVLKMLTQLTAIHDFILHPQGVIPVTAYTYQQRKKEEKQQQQLPTTCWISLHPSSLQIKYSIAMLNSIFLLVLHTFPVSMA